MHALGPTRGKSCPGSRRSGHGSPPRLWKEPRSLRQPRRGTHRVLHAPRPRPCSAEASGQVATDPCSTLAPPASSSSPDRPSGPGPSFRGKSVRQLGKSVRQLPKLSVPALMCQSSGKFLDRRANTD